MPYASSIFNEWKQPSKTQKKRLTKQSRIFLKVTYFLEKKVHTKNSGKIKNIKGKLAKTILKKQLTIYERNTLILYKSEKMGNKIYITYLIFLVLKKPVAL